MAEPPDIVFVVLDAVRRDRVSCFGYDRDTTPNVDAFAAGATVYENAVAQAPWSIPAHASLFTGQYSHEHGATTVAPVLRNAETLAEVLGRNGYRSCGISPNEYVRPVTGLARGFDEFRTDVRTTVPNSLVGPFGRVINALSGSRTFRPPVESAFNRLKLPGGGDTDPDSTRTDEDLLDAAATFLDATDDPAFLFVNLMDAHLPRSPEPRFRDRFLDADLADADVPSNERAHNFGRDVLDDRGLEKLSQLYDADVATADARFGQLLARLESRQSLDDALVVAVADHGENLGEFGLIGHQHAVTDGVTSVPLIVRYPDQGGQRRVASQVETRRVFHTILDVAGARRYPNRSLERVEAERPAVGEFLSPMVDVDHLGENGADVYDADLLGETLSFVQQAGHKVVRWRGEDRLYRTPDCPENERPIAKHRGLYRDLVTAFPEPLADGAQTMAEASASRRDVFGGDGEGRGTRRWPR